MTNREHPPLTDSPEAVDGRFAVNMQRARERAGMSQVELVRKLRDLGGWSTVHQTTVSRIEKGDRQARIGEALAIAHVLGISLESLVFDPNESAAVSELASRARALHDAFFVAREAIDECLTLRTEVEASLSRVERLGIDHYPVPLARRALQLTPEIALSQARGESPRSRRIPQ